MNEIVKKVLDRGVPLQTPVFIDLHEFLKLFDDNSVYEDYKKCVKEILCGISNIIDEYSGNIALPTYASINVNEENHKYLTFSGENFYFVISNLLECADFDKLVQICENDDLLDQELKKILSITTEQELKNKYPGLYDLYEEKKESSANFVYLDKMINDKSVPRDDILINYSHINNNFKNFYPNFNMEKAIKDAYNFSLKDFLEKMCDTIKKYIDNSEDIISLYQTYSLDLDSLKESDFEKLDLYIAAIFMEFVEDKDNPIKQRYLFYLTNYFKDNVETKVTRVKIKYKEKKTTPISLYERYKKVLLENPDLMAVNFKSSDFIDMKQEEIEEFIVAYLSELSANWELISPNDETVEKEVRKSVRRKYRNLNEEERKQKQDKLLNLFIKKKTFFDSTDPYFRIRGKNTFDGYVGFIYANSVVILDKFYDNAEKEKISAGDAIYIMSMADFYELSQHSKSYLIANHLCNRVIHKGKWQEKVLKYIKRKTNESPVSETNKLIEEEKVKVRTKDLI